MLDATTLKRRINDQTAAVVRLREALAYYADDAVYDSGDVLDDRGDTARVALGLSPRHKHPPLSMRFPAEADEGEPSRVGPKTEA